MNAGGRDGAFRYRDDITEQLAILSSARDSVYKTYQANANRSHYIQGHPFVRDALEANTAVLKGVVASFDKALIKTLKRHTLFPWLTQLKGVCGAHVARLIGTIGDPHRFPGKLCENGHHSPADAFGICVIFIGEKGTKRDDMKACGARLGPERRGTGSRSLWHYCGVHVDAEGRAPRKRKGQKCSWNPLARACLLMPDGIADQLVRHQCEPYVGTYYYPTKTRLKSRRGVVIEDSLENDIVGGNAAPDADKGGEAVMRRDIERSVEPLRPFQIDAIARKVAVKAFVADLLREWKRAAPIERESK